MNEKMTFEEANQLLDETVKKMENQSLTLDQSVALYAKACELLAFCVKELDSYQGKITDIHTRLLQVTQKEEKTDEN